MKPTASRSRASDSLIAYSLSVFLRHALPLIGIALIAASGRFIQAGLREALPTMASWTIEAIVWAARIMMVLIIMGGGSVSSGIVALRRILLLSDEDRETAFSTATKTAQVAWPTLIREFVLFALLILALNWAITIFANSALTAGLLTQWGFDSNSPGTRSGVALFIKNLTVIPLTIVFQYACCRFLLRACPFHS